MNKDSFLSFEEHVSHLESTYKGGLDQFLRDCKLLENKSKAGQYFPQDILVEICQYCLKPTILNLLLVSKDWNFMLHSSPLLWQRLLKIYWKIERKTTDSDEKVREYVIKRINAEILSLKLENGEKKNIRVVYSGRQNLYGVDWNLKDRILRKNPKYHSENASLFFYQTIDVSVGTEETDDNCKNYEGKFFIWDSETINHTKVCCKSNFHDTGTLASCSIQMDLDNEPFLYIRQSCKDYALIVHDDPNWKKPEKVWYFPINGNKFDEICEKYGILENENIPNQITSLLETFYGEEEETLFGHMKKEDLDKMKIFLVFLKFLFQDGKLGFYKDFRVYFENLGSLGVGFDVIFSRK